MKVSVYIATSLDGFIARDNGDLDWLVGEGPAPAGEDYGYKAFMDTVDAIVMGRGTFDKVLTFGAWPYPNRLVTVLSSRALEAPEAVLAGVERLAGAPAEIHAQLAARGVQHVYLDGGATIRQFLSAGLIDRLIITRVPILIGSGIPLFGPLGHDLRLDHVATRSYASGLVQDEYEPADR